MADWRQVVLMKPGTGHMGTARFFEPTAARTPQPFRGGVGEPQWDFLEPFIDAARLEEAIKSKVIAPLVEVSSSDLRERVKRGKSIRYQVSPAVELFIRENGLYR